MELVDICRYTSRTDDPISDDMSENRVRSRRLMNFSPIKRSSASATHQLAEKSEFGANFKSNDIRERNDVAR